VKLRIDAIFSSPFSCPLFESERIFLYFIFLLFTFCGRVESKNLRSVHEWTVILKLSFLLFLIFMFLLYFILFYRFILGITMNFDRLVRLIPQSSTIICHDMKHI